MNIAILGFAREGQSALEYYSGLGGHDITICDQDNEKTTPKGVKTSLGDSYLQGLDKYDVLVRTPALHPQDIATANPDSPDILSKITTVTNEFLRVCPTKNVIGVTGTKGKGTTASLIAKMLECAGKTVHLGGNIGIPPLDLLKNNIKPTDWVVLELSNFQLIDLGYSPHIAVCLMVEPEHLDWHVNMDEYLDAKRQLFRHQSKQDLAIYYAANTYSLSIAEVSPGVLLPFMNAPGAEVVDDAKIVIDGTKICDITAIKLLGKHNWQNVCAAITAAWQITHDAETLQSAIIDFKGLPHRLELVKKVNDVKFYNDSFASVPAASVAAITAISGPKVMIVGGFDRGLDLNALAKAFMENSADIRRVILFGASAKRLETALQEHGLENYDVLDSKDIKQIILHAQKIAQEGDSVVLSPGFPSFDMFKNFEDRGIKFKEAVNEL